MIGEVTERATAMWDDGARWDEILGTLRDEGFSKVECIRATVEILHLPLADAKPDRSREPGVGGPPRARRPTP